MIMITRLLNAGFKIQKMEQVPLFDTFRVIIETPGGEKHSGEGADVESAIVQSLTRTTITIEAYLNRISKENADLTAELFNLRTSFNTMVEDVRSGREDGTIIYNNGQPIKFVPGATTGTMPASAQIVCEPATANQEGSHQCP